MNFNKCDLDRSKLPTKRNVMEYLMFLRHKGTPNVPKNERYTSYANYASEPIIELWKHTKISIIGQAAVRKAIVNLANTYYEIGKHTYLYVQEDWNKLFMISRCKCYENSTTNTCACSTTNAIPDSERDFFLISVDLDYVHSKH